MDSFAQIRIERISARSPHLQSVKNLADENSETLGFFPAGAFDEQASRGQILVALHGDRTCIAYLLYRVTRNRAFIVHLCVDGPWRSKGIAKLLVDELVGRTSQYQGIGLWCRRREAFHSERFCDDYSSVKERAKDPRDWLAVYMMDNGTWNTPIVLLDNSSGKQRFPNGVSMKSPYHLLEGHRRLSFLVGLKKLHKAKPKHKVWVVSLC
jgi:GNAT superfamily N-acetyltransferase